MARLLALEWDADQARVVVARTRGKDVLVEHAFTIDLAENGAASGEESTPAKENEANSANIGPRLAAALAARQVSRGETLVAIGRTSIELRQMQLPPCPAEELPDLVRFQAMRQFSNMTEDWPLDYLPLPTTDDSNQVLAAAMSPQMASQLRRACESADLEMTHLVLRPFAAASLLKRHQSTRSGCCVMIDVLGDEADLSVLLDGHIVFTRTVRLPAHGTDSAMQSNALLGELRRTIAASRSQMNNRDIDRVVVCGAASNHETLINAIRSNLHYEVETFDPFEEVDLDRSLQSALPENSGRYAPLIGMLCDEADSIPHTIDFLHPRRAPAPANHRRTYTIAAATVGVVLLLAGIAAFIQLRSFDKQITQLSGDLKVQQETLDVVNEQLSDMQTMEQFVAGDVVWLDELAFTSENFLPAEQAEVTNLTAAVTNENQGRLTLEGYMAESTLLKDLENRLRDGQHQVVGRGTDYTPNRSRLPWRFNETVVVQVTSAEGRQEAATRDDAKAATSVSEAGEASEDAGAASAVDDASEEQSSNIDERPATNQPAAAAEDEQSTGSESDLNNEAVPDGSQLETSSVDGSPGADE